MGKGVRGAEGRRGRSGEEDMRVKNRVISGGDTSGGDKW